ncbi:MAG: hypothetical protein MJ137_00460 [Clostridia bacterium]|nr:hypothetical protein [Clostridia bacterium]
MYITSAEANKLLKKLNEEYRSLTELEGKSKSFVAAVGEDIETVRPVYDFEETQKKLDETAEKIRRLKHAVNVFNTTHKVGSYDMTVDEILVSLPIMSEKLKKLSAMKNVLPKTRGGESYRPSASGIIEYTYANYDIAKAAEAYDRLSDEISDIQLALDALNTSEKFEVDI